MWNHNIHFHNYMLRQLPKKINRVLDYIYSMISVPLNFFIYTGIVNQILHQLLLLQHALLIYR